MSRNAVCCLSLFLASSAALRSTSVPSGVYQGAIDTNVGQVTFSFNFHEAGKVDCVQDGPYRNEVDGDPYKIESNGVNFTRTSPVSLPNFTSLLGSIFETAADRFHYSHEPITDIVYIIADDRGNDTGTTIPLMKPTPPPPAPHPVPTPTGVYNGFFETGLYTITFSFNFHEKGKVDCVQDGPYRNEVDGDPYTLESDGVNFTRPASLPNFTSLLGSIFETAADRFHYSHEPITDIVYIIADDRGSDTGAVIPLTKPTPVPPAPHPVPKPTGTYSGKYTPFDFSFIFHEEGKVDCFQDGPYRNEVDGDPYTLESNGVNFTRSSPVSLPNFTSLLGSIFETAADRFHYSHEPITDVVYIIADDRGSDEGAIIPLTKKA